MLNFEKILNMIDWKLLVTIIALAVSSAFSLYSIRNQKKAAYAVRDKKIHILKKQMWTINSMIDETGWLQHSSHRAPYIVAVQTVLNECCDNNEDLNQIACVLQTLVVEVQKIFGRNVTGQDVIRFREIHDVLTNSFVTIRKELENTKIE
jgi:hypothetical protein